MAESKERKERDECTAVVDLSKKLSMNFSGASFAGDAQISAHLHSHAPPREYPLVEALKRERPVVWGPEGDFPKQSIFVGREKLLEELKLRFNVRLKDINESKEKCEQEAIMATVITACKGLGGIGKTQLALKYARENQKNHSLVVWFPSENIETLKNYYIEFAKALGIANEKPSFIEAQNYVKDFLYNDEALTNLGRKNLGWLLIFDNALNYESIAPFLPEKGGNVLITSRHQIWPDKFNLPVPLMTEIEGIDLIKILIHQSKEDNTGLEALKELVELLHGLPLALAQAGAFIANYYKKITVSEYINLYQQSKEELLKSKIMPADAMHEPVAVTWYTSLNVIEKEDEKDGYKSLSLRLLEVCSYLDPERIPNDFLKTWLKVYLPQVKNEEILFSKILTGLGNYSLIFINKERDITSIHRLVQEVIRLNHKDDMERWFKQLFQAFFIEWEKEESLLQDETRRLGLLSHMRVALEYYDKLKLSLNISVYIMEHIGFSLHYYLGKSEEALAFYERALNIRKKNSLDIERNLSNIANIYETLGKPEKQKQILKEALTTCKDQKVRASILFGLSNLYKYDPKKRKVYLEEVLAIEEGLYPPNHIEFFKTYNSFAGMFRDTKDYEKAKKHADLAATICKKHYGENHREYSLILFTIAAIGFEMGAYRQAKMNLERGLKIIETSYGKDSIHSFDFYLNLGIVYRRMNYLNDAEFILQKALKIRNDKNLIETARIFNNLAKTYSDQGQKELAIRAMENALEIERRCNAGPEDLAITYRDLANIYLNYGEMGRAKEHLETALKTLNGNSDFENPELIFIVADLRAIFFSLNDFNSIYHLESKYDSVFRDQIEWQDVEYNGSLIEDKKEYDELIKQATNSYKRGEYPKAVFLYQRVMSFKNFFQSEKEDQATLYYNLGSAYHKVGSYLNAISVLDKCLRIRGSIIIVDKENAIKKVQSKIAMCNEAYIKIKKKALCTSSLLCEKNKRMKIENFLFQIKNGKSQGLKLKKGVVLSGKLPGCDSEIQFEEFESNGDVNCYFEALGTTRTELISLLLSKSYDEYFRESLGYEMTVAIRKNSLRKAATKRSIELSNCYLKLQVEISELVKKTNELIKKNHIDYSPLKAKKLIKYLTKHQSEEKEYANILAKLRVKLQEKTNCETEISEYVKSVELYESYIKLLENDGWLSYNMIQLVAEIWNYNIYIWHKLDDSTRIMCPEYGQGVSPKSTIHILRIDKFTRFNFLLEANTIQATMDAEKTIVAPEPGVKVKLVASSDITKLASNPTETSTGIHSGLEPDSLGRVVPVSPSEAVATSAVFQGLEVPSGTLDRCSVIATETNLNEINKLVNKFEKKQEKEVEVAAELTPQQTEGRGDCAFHASLGVWSPSFQKFICTNVTVLRKRIADEIRSGTKSGANRAIMEAMQQMIIAERHGGKAFRLAKEQFQKFLASHEKQVQQAWEEFEKELMAYPEIIAFINERAPLGKDLRNKVFICLQNDDNELYGMILSLEDLHTKHKTYTEKTTQGVKWDTLLQDKELREEYAQLMERAASEKTEGYWLLPGELEIIAIVLNMTIELNITDRKTKKRRISEIYNPHCAEKVSVYFNGRNHYERMETKPRLELESGKSKSSVTANAIQDERKSSQEQSSLKVTERGTLLYLQQSHIKGALRATVEDSLGQLAKADASKAIVEKDTDIQVKSVVHRGTTSISESTGSACVEESKEELELKEVQELASSSILSSSQPSSQIHAQGAHFGGPAILYAHSESHSHYHSPSKAPRKYPLLEQLKQGKGISWGRGGALPRQDIEFVERETLLKELESKLALEDKEAKEKIEIFAITVCAGLGGIGKTQLALKYIRDTQNAYTLRAWFPAEDKVVLQQCYMELAEALGYSEDKPSFQNAQIYLKQWLSQNPGWLLVYDNVTNYKSIQDFLPHQGGRVLLTTRQRDWPSSFRILEIKVMTEEESLILIASVIGRKIEKKEIEGAKVLVKTLGYLPLALAQAGAYLKVNGIDIPKYLELYKKHEAMLLAEKGPEGTSGLPVAVTWDINLEAIIQEAKDQNQPVFALHLLTVCAYLAPEKISYDLILAWFKIAYPKLESELILPKVIGQLWRYSMVNRDEDRNVTVHRLVQSILRDKHKQAFQKGITIYPLLLTWFKTTYPKTAYPELEFELILPKVIGQLWHYSMVNCDEDRDAYGNVDIHRLVQNNLRDKHKQAFEKGVTIYPPLDIGWYEILLGVAHNEFEHSDEARQESLLPHLQTLIEHFEKLLLPEQKTNKYYGHILADIGRVFQCHIKDWKSAQRYYEKALNIFESEKVYGKNSPEVADILVDLGSACGDLGDFKKEKELLERALDIYNKNKHDKDHLKIRSVILHNLGNVYAELGIDEKNKEHLEKSKTLLEDALAIQKQEYGKDSPKVAGILADLGCTYGKLGYVGKKREHLEEALGIQEQEYGKDHPEVAKILHNLGNAYWELYNIEKHTPFLEMSKTFLERARDIYEKKYGKEHLDVAKILHSLSRAYKSLGDVKGAKELLEQRVIPIFNEYYKINHHYKKIAEDLLYECKQLLESEIQQKLSQAETKSSKEAQRNMRAPLLSSGLPNRLEKRNIIEPAELIKVLEQCKLGKDGKDLPTPELALRRAAVEGKIEIVKTLVRIVEDIDINQAGPSGKTAIMFAEECNKMDVVEFLKSIGAKFVSDEPTDKKKTVRSIS